MFSYCVNLIPIKFRFFTNFQKFGQRPCTIAHGFFPKKWLRNHQKFLLHFLTHIDVLMLCRKFGLILSSNFRVMAILKNEPISENFPVL